MTLLSEPAAVAPSSASGGIEPERVDGETPRASPGSLHGRMLQVSRLATIGEMAAGIAHELNQPLTAIANYAQACERLLGRPHVQLSDVREALGQIAAQAVRAGDIIRRLRRLAASEPARRQPADINATIEQIRDLIEADARSHQATVVVGLGTDLPAVLIDAAQIQHVILNLVHNAFEAPGLDGGGREVRIQTGLTAEGDVEIAIRDDGLGLTGEAIERMFDPFFSTKSSGTGLGLPISHTLVRAHGGTLGHRPNAPRGSCFYIHLPVEAPGGEAHESTVDAESDAI
jgi:two-component system, LuxR family, sensor kinase FixL